MTEQQTTGTDTVTAPFRDDAPYPAVVVDRSGSVRAVNRAAGALFTDAVPGLGEALQGFPPVPSRWIDPDQARSDA